MDDETTIPADGDWHEVDGVFTADEVMVPVSYGVVMVQRMTEDGMEPRVILVLNLPCDAHGEHPLRFDLALEAAALLGNDLWESQEQTYLGTRHHQEAVRLSRWQRALNRARRMPQPLQQRPGTTTSNPSHLEAKGGRPWPFRP